METIILSCPDSTYFRNSDVKPYIQNGKFHIYDGKGTRRSSWGAPTVKSTVEKLTEEIICVTVVGWHKHTVSPVGGKYWFILQKGEWKNTTANNKLVREYLGKLAEEESKRKAELKERYGDASHIYSRDLGKVIPNPALS